MPAECFSDVQAIGFLLAAIVTAIMLVGGGYMAGYADSRRHGRNDDEQVPDPRRYKPPTKPR